MQVVQTGDAEVVGRKSTLDEAIETPLERLDSDEPTAITSDANAGEAVAREVEEQQVADLQSVYLGHSEKALKDFCDALKAATAKHEAEKAAFANAAAQALCRHML